MTNFGFKKYELHFFEIMYAFQLADFGQDFRVVPALFEIHHKDQHDIGAFECLVSFLLDGGQLVAANIDIVVDTAGHGLIDLHIQSDVTVVFLLYTADPCNAEHRAEDKYEQYETDLERPGAQHDPQRRSCPQPCCRRKSAHLVFARDDDRPHAEEADPADNPRRDTAQIRPPCPESSPEIDIDNGGRRRSEAYQRKGAHSGRVMLRRPLQPDDASQYRREQQTQCDRPCGKARKIFRKITYHLSLPFLLFYFDVLF